MTEYVWFLIAFVEFVVLLIVFAPKIYATLTNTDRVPTADGGKRGIIKRLELTKKGVLATPITTFEIQEPTGNIYYAGLEGHATDLLNGMEIEFWPSYEFVAFSESVSPVVNKDGTTSREILRQEYYNLSKYRIIPKPEEVANESLWSDEIID